MDSTMVLILGIGGALGVLLLVIGIVVTASSERNLVEQRLGKYLDDEKDRNASKSRQKSSPIGDWVDKRLEKSNVGGGVARELARADIKLKPGEYFAAMVIFGVGLAFIFWYLNDRDSKIPVFTLLGFIIGLYIPRYYVKGQQTKRLMKFNDQLADMLNLMVNSLRAGYSIMQAMEAVSREMPPPLCDEFRRLVQEMQIGIPMEQALQNLLRRIPSEDLDLVITAINVQKEVGGNLAEILDIISYTIRERVRVKGEIRVLTTQVIYSGKFLALMPVIISAVLWFLNRPYMMEFFNPATRIPGIIALSTGGLMIAAGYFVMTRIAKIDV